MIESEKNIFFSGSNCTAGLHVHHARDTSSRYKHNQGESEEDTRESAKPRKHDREPGEMEAGEHREVLQQCCKRCPSGHIQGTFKNYKVQLKAERVTVITKMPQVNSDTQKIEKILEDTEVVRRNVHTLIQRVPDRKSEKNFKFLLERKKIPHVFRVRVRPSLPGNRSDVRRQDVRDLLEKARAGTLAESTGAHGADAPEGSSQGQVPPRCETYFG